MAARRRRRVTVTPFPRREEFNGDDLAWHDALTTHALDVLDDTDLALRYLITMPDDVEALINECKKEHHLS